jgi:hypothetical protein
MTVIVPHNKTRAEAIATIDRAADSLFSGIAGDSVQIVDEKKAWSGSTMTFSFTGSLGFIEVPISGTIDVDDHNVTVNCALPAMEEQFLGEGKIQSEIDRKVRGVLA